MKTEHVIVVGVDGSEGGRRALRWAVDQARVWGAAVRVVAVWSWDGIESLPPVAGSPPEERARTAKLVSREIDELPAAIRDGVPISVELVEGRAADVLSSAASGADLLVLGSHGHGRVWHAVAGSVSEECVRKAACPVVIVPVPRPAPKPAEPAVMALRV